MYVMRQLTHEQGYAFPHSHFLQYDDNSLIML